MSLTSVSQTIRGYFDANFNECPYTFENLNFETDPDLWCKVNIITSTPEQQTLTRNGCYLENGLIDVQIFEKAMTGTYETERIADIIANLLMQKNINGVKTMLPEFRKVGIVQNTKKTNSSNFNQTNVFVRYNYQQKP